MAVVQTAGELATIDKPAGGVSARSSVPLYGGLALDYAKLWRSQPNVRLVTSFLARNIAQLGIKAYRRLSDTDREHLSGHPLSATLGRPNHRTTRYRFVNALVHDLAIFDRAYLAKVRGDDGRLALVRLPPQKVHLTGDNWLWADGFELKGRKASRSFGADEVVHFRGYSPDDPRDGVSPLESLRQILAEEGAAGEWREQYWHSAGRQSGIIERPAPGHPEDDWSPEARARFLAGWQANWAGRGPGAGGTPLLEDGMKYVPTGFSPLDSQYLEGRKLSRAECAAAYFVSPLFVGILDHANFSNVSEQHKHLYQDTLGPWLTMIEEEIELQLVPDFADVEGVYVEFNLAEKLKGNFEEQAKGIQTMVGRPVMTANEGRARLNLPRATDPAADALVVPLNVLIGGQASPTDSAPPPKARRGGRKSRSAVATAHVAKHAETLEGYFARQRESIMGRLGSSTELDEVWDAERWDGELAVDLLALSREAAADAGAVVAERFGSAFDVDDALAFLVTNSSIAAGAINGTTRAGVASALDDDEDVVTAVRSVLDDAVSTRAPQIAQSRVTTAAGFGALSAAGAAGATTKRWVVTSGSPRASHAAMAGEAVAIDEVFSNGAAWPGDPSLPVDETAGCSCEIDFE